MKTSKEKFNNDDGTYFSHYRQRLVGGQGMSCFLFYVLELDRISPMDMLH